MKNSLPQYIITAFTVSGYDEIEDICEMDTGEGPNNSVTTIENYINKKKFKTCRAPHQTDYEPFEFPPGHRKKIE